MSDITKDLRDMAKAQNWCQPEETPEWQAADTIESLRAELAEMREALTKIATGEGVYGAQAHEYKQIARAALTDVSVNSTG